MDFKDEILDMCLYFIFRALFSLDDGSEFWTLAKTGFNNKILRYRKKLRRGYRKILRYR